MSDIYKGELQDYEGNTIYPHSEADVIFCTDGETTQSKLNKYENALGKVTGVTDSLEVDDSKILVSAKALHKVNSSLESQPDFVYDEAGKITGYKTKIGGADTVFPFSGGLNAIITVRSVSSVYSSAGNKQGDTLLDTQFTIKNGKVESTKVITNVGTSAGGWSIKPVYSSILSIKDNK